jgi:serine/threonine protein kinase
MTDNNMNNDKINKGGRVLASGGYGCVFAPALLCQRERKRKTKRVSKLMTKKNAIKEYDKIKFIKEKLMNIKDYKKYFLLYSINLCKVKHLKKTDLKNYTKKCRALKKDKITEKNINQNLDRMLSLNMPNGGLPVDEYLYKNVFPEKMYKLHVNLTELLKKGIIPMNNRNIYHSDIKDSNILVDNKLKTRLIDWGIATEYVPFQNNNFPSGWKNRPFQFNTPFTIILFTDHFIEKYTLFLQFNNNTKTNRRTIEKFVNDYIVFWMKERGEGHYKFINESLNKIFGSSFDTMNCIINYITEVLYNFIETDSVTKNIKNYLDRVFIKIIDVWGFISVYFVFILLFYKNYSKLTFKEIQIFKKIKFIMSEYLYKPRIEPINMNALFFDLKDLERFF